MGVKMLLKASHQRKSRARWNSLLDSTNFQERSILLHLFHKRKSNGTSQSPFYEATIFQTSKSGKHATKKKSTDNFLMNIDEKILNKIFANQIQEPIIMIIYYD